MPATRPALARAPAPLAVPRLIITPSSPVLPLYAPASSSASYFTYPSDPSLLAPPVPYAAYAARRRSSSPSPPASTYAYHYSFPPDGHGDKDTHRRARRSATLSLALLLLAFVLVVSSALSPASIPARMARHHAAFDAPAPAPAGPYAYAYAPAGLYTYRASSGSGTRAWAPAAAAARWSGPQLDGQPLPVDPAQLEAHGRVARWGPRAAWRNIVQDVQRGGLALDAWDFH
ncbi:hypothetical protein Q5752_006977 [Cryptotrichosporon argae]